MINNLIKNIGRCGMLREKINRMNGDKKLMMFTSYCNNNVNTMSFSSQATTNKGSIMAGDEMQNDNYFTQQNQTNKYTQRAYTPSQMSSQLLNELSHSKHSQQQILHQLSLYYNKLLPFDYDYFTESLRRLIHYQQKLSMQELLMLFDLAIQYKIDSLILEKQFMNEIYCRVYLGMKKELLEYDNKMQEQLDVTYKKLQAMSKDHFEIIDEKFRELLEQEQKQQDEQQTTQQQTDKKFPSSQKQKIKNKPIYNAGSRKNKSKKITPQILNRITKIFVDTNSKNIEFNKLLLEVHTTRMDQAAIVEEKVEENGNNQQKSLTPESLLLYTRLTINMLQLYMTEYQSTLSTSKNKQNKYTHRSVKNIYKLQHFYYYQVTKMIEEKLLLSKATNQQLLEFVNVLSAFPIKRRSFRKAVGEVVIEEFKKRELYMENMMGFFQLSRFDNKLLQHFEKKINQGKQLPQSQVNELQKQETSQKKTLTADVIIDSQTQQTDQSTFFKMPLSLFKKVTKKKSKPKNKKPQESEMEIDLTQPDQEISTQTHNQIHANKEAQQENKK